MKPGAPGRIRTRDPLLRRQLLCPAELRAPERNCARPRSRDGHTKVPVCRPPTTQIHPRVCQQPTVPEPAVNDDSSAKPKPLSCGSTPNPNSSELRSCAVRDQWGRSRIPSGLRAKTRSPRAALGPRLTTRMGISLLLSRQRWNIAAVTSAAEGQIQAPGHDGSRAPRCQPARAHGSSGPESPQREKNAQEATAALGPRGSEYRAEPGSAEPPDQ